jgi:hypothetical protein
MGKHKMTRQAGQYDKIFRENMEAVIPHLLQHVLGIDPVQTEELPDDLQHTKERKPDVLKKITDTQQNTFVLHLEFQLVDEADMIFRMADYYVMLARMYKLPVRQYVIFIGPDSPKMSTTYASQALQFSFNLLSFLSFDYQSFLQSDKPEEVVFSVLANFRQEHSEQVLRQIVQRLAETTDGELALKKYFQQLRILAQLRSLESNLKNVMDSLANYISEERDVLYMRGREKAATRFITYLLKETDYSNEKIALLAEMPVEFVQALKQKIAG